MKKFILSLDTSTNLCSVSIKHNSYYIEINNLTKKKYKKNNEHILSNINYITLISKIKLYNINIISFNFGPGSFTGLRLSSIICKGLFFNKKNNIIRISNFHNIALATWKKYKNTYTFISLHSKYNEIYFCLLKFNINKKIIQPIMPESINNINNFKSFPSNYIYTGNAFSIKENIKYKKNLLKSIYNKYPTAKYTSLLSEAYLKNNISTTINNTSPNYIIENIF
ncbi:MAG: tRNA (adenosine(37)-N6)-threonylcarbamoyltransferase complex dimerization subunit type 1 TsaB [Candidatus Azosocius agrarius]|nr:MAG: tRNA (adenosine(37)-N6)-threonylcarbamoyltransferase complex dimerization subunit type 1 TsaB [Gammaproteobacteria bacterium]